MVYTGTLTQESHNARDSLPPIRPARHAGGQTVPAPEPSPDQVVIDVKAAAVNFPDVLIIQNQYPFKPELPFTPGAECAGVVRAVGSDVSRSKPGDRRCIHADLRHIAPRAGEPRRASARRDNAGAGRRCRRRHRGH